MLRYRVREGFYYKGKKEGQVFGPGKILELRQEDLKGQEWKVEPVLNTSTAENPVRVDKPKPKKKTANTMADAVAKGVKNAEEKPITKAEDKPSVDKMVRTPDEKKVGQGTEGSPLVREEKPKKKGFFSRLRKKKKRKADKVVK